MPESKLVVIASDDAFILGCCSSRVHVRFAERTGGWLGVGNDATYNHADCFAKFPFPACTDTQAARIRQLAESLDAHRKRQQSLHPDLTITGMYNVLEKLRKGEPLSAKEKVIHEQGLVSVLKQIHDELDEAVFDAYGWPRDLSDEEILERLVALNAERAEEERRGLVRWLRPDFQNPSGKKEATQVSFDTGEEETAEEAPKTAPAWPKKLPEQVAAVRDLLSRNAKSGFSAREVGKAFKGAKAKDVEMVLESLAALGIAVSYEKAGERRWMGAGRGAA